MSNNEVQNAIGILMKNAQKMMDGGGLESIQDRMDAQRSKLVEARVGDCLTVRANLAIEINEIAPDEKFWAETQEAQLNLLKSAINQALHEAKEAARSQMGDMARMMGMTEKA